MPKEISRLWTPKCLFRAYLSLFCYRNKTLHEVASYLKLLPAPDVAGVEANREFLLEMLVRITALGALWLSAGIRNLQNIDRCRPRLEQALHPEKGFFNTCIFVSWDSLCQASGFTLRKVSLIHVFSYPEIACARLWEGRDVAKMRQQAQALGHLMKFTQRGIPYRFGFEHCL